MCLAGPAGTGKSRNILEYIHHRLSTNAGARALIVRKTRESLSESGLFTFEKHVLGDGHPMAPGSARRFRQSYIYPNGSEFVTGGLDNSQKILSTEYDIIYIQEATEVAEADYDVLSTRLRNNVTPVQQMLMDCNPSYPKHWIKIGSEKDKLHMVETRHEDNPVLYDLEAGEWTDQGVKYLERLKTLTGVLYKRLFLGLWVGAEGMVYEYDSELHLVDPFKVPRHWRKIRSIDFGFVAPFVCQWWAISPKNEMYLYRQLYHTGRLIEDHAALITERSRGEEIEASVADHDAEDRATLRRAGIVTIPAYKEITPGINAVAQRLRVHQDTGKPRLFVVKDSLIESDRELVDLHKPISTEEEFEMFVYAKTTTGVQKEEPAPGNDHGMDAMRYAVAYIDGLKTGQQQRPSAVTSQVKPMTVIEAIRQLTPLSVGQGRQLPDQPWLRSLPRDTK